MQFFGEVFESLTETVLPCQSSCAKFPNFSGSFDKAILSQEFNVNKIAPVVLGFVFRQKLKGVWRFYVLLVCSPVTDLTLPENVGLCGVSAHKCVVLVQ